MRILTLVIVLLPVVAGSQIPTEGLVAYYPFNGDAQDESGNGYHGKPHNGVSPTADRFENPSSAYAFDGVNDYIMTSFSPIYSRTDPFTVSFWVEYGPSIDSNDRIMGLEKTHAQEFSFMPRYGINMRFYYRDDSSDYTDCNSYLNYDDGRWHHILVTRDTVSDEISLYADGSLETTVPDNTTADMNATDTRTLAIGATNHVNGVALYFNGLIDDIRFYDHKLDNAEILALYHENGWDSIFTVSGTIYGPDGGLFGVPVDLLDAEGVNLGSTASDQSGFYIFEEVWPGDYTVSIAPPLGYIPDVESKDITVAGEDVVCDFYLGAVDLVYDQRSVGFWKHQLTVYLTGQGNAQIPVEEFLGFLSLIGQHFNNNPINPVTLYELPEGASQWDSLEVAYELVGLRGRVTMEKRAKQQLMALLLNVASNYLPQWAPISDDGATASQAITYCWALIADGDAANDELAKDIADLINNGEFIEAGVIPLTVDNISYTPKPPLDVVIPDEFVLMQNYPNPVTQATTFEYGLPVSCTVTLTIHDLQGRTVETLVADWQEAGTQCVSWDATRYTAGAYLCRLAAGDRVFIKKLTVLR